jgi:hypothetical protein
MDCINLDEETFDEIFQLIPTGDGDCSWQAHEIQESGIPDNRVWTIIEGDDGGLYLIPGWHYINKFGMAVSTVSWDPADEDKIEGIYMEPSICCDRCGSPQDGISASEWCGECGTCLDCCDHGGMCRTSFMAGAECILRLGHDGSHRSGE